MIYRIRIKTKISVIVYSKTHRYPFVCFIFSKINDNFKNYYETIVRSSQNAIAIQKNGTEIVKMVGQVRLGYPYCSIYYSPLAQVRLGYPYFSTYYSPLGQVMLGYPYCFIYYSPLGQVIPTALSTIARQVRLFLLLYLLQPVRFSLHRFYSLQFVSFQMIQNDGFRYSYFKQSAQIVPILQASMMTAFAQIKHTLHAPMTAVFRDGMRRL